MEILVFLGILVVIFICFVFRGLSEDKKKKEKLKKQLKADYGKPNVRTWKTGELDIISRYSEKKKRDYCIDSLTWNDLDMDDVYRQMAYTHSSVGDDYLYYLLKNPRQDKESLLRLERIISYFQDSQEERISLQVLFFGLGRMKKYSLSDYLEYIEKAVPEGNLKHYVAIGLLAASILLMSYHAGYGLMLFFLILLYNIVSYFKHKAALEPYLVSFRYILKLLDYGKEVAQVLPLEWTASSKRSLSEKAVGEKEIVSTEKNLSEKTSEEKEKLLQIIKKLRKFQQNSYLLMSPGRMTGEGLELILDYLRMCLHLDIIKFNQMLRQVQGHKEEIWQLYEIMGELDASIAIGEYRAFLPEYSIPVIKETEEISMREGYHPLILGAVPNSIKIRKNILLTGSNASGKSTFLRTMGMNVLLAQTIHTCTAEEFILPLCRLFTSMDIKDSIQGKESYYMAEIKAIKRILEAARKNCKVVCMVDEVLRGTNTIERIAASTQILKGMAERNIICLAATHDIELTRTLEKEYDNYHFEEDLVQGDIRFSYQLKKGRADTSNAIDLLAGMGYEPALIEKARKMVHHFKKQGEWI